MAVAERAAVPDVDRLARGAVEALRKAGLLQIGVGPDGPYVRLPEGRVGSVNEAVRAVAFSLRFDLASPSLAPPERARAEDGAS
jgi:hypothetical protein